MREPRGLGRVEERGRDRGVERDGELAVGLRAGGPAPGADEDKGDEDGPAPERTHIGSPHRVTFTPEASPGSRAAAALRGPAAR